MNTQETKAVNDAAVNQNTYVESEVVDAFIAGAQFLDDLRKQSEPKTGSYNKVINVDIKMDVVTLTNQQGDTFEFPNNEYHEGLVDFLFSYDVPSKPKTNVGEAGKELVSEIDAALMQPDKELFEFVQSISESPRPNTQLAETAFIVDVRARAKELISNYEKQSK